MLAFQDHPKALVISAMGGGWETWDVQPNLAAEGFDSCNIVLARDYRNASVSGSALSAEFPIGEAMGSMYIQGCRVRCHMGGIWIAEVQTRGAYSPSRAQKVTIRSGVEQQSADNVEVPGIGEVAHLQTLESTPAVDVGYISFGQPQTARIGSMGSPPWPVAVRGSVWASGDEACYHYPHGWVLIDMSAEKLVGAEVWWITESWRWIHKWSP
jgi:hypothetical protein